MDLDFLKTLIKPNDTKIVLIVIDGLGGLPREKNGITELETARTPNLDLLASESICGLQQPVNTGITPGSGPGHLALFGYNPVKYQVGRGILAAHGIGFDLRPGDVAARGNFCTIDENGRVTDRRAGRISTEKNQELCELLRNIKIPGVEVFVETVKEHRLLLVLRGQGLSGKIIDTDPQEIGKKPLDQKPLLFFYLYPFRHHIWFAIFSGQHTICLFVADKFFLGTIEGNFTSEAIRYIAQMGQHSRHISCLDIAGQILSLSGAKSMDKVITMTASARTRQVHRV